MKNKEKKLLEEMLAKRRILRSDLERVMGIVSDQVVQKKYQELFKAKDVKTARKLYDLFETPPGREIREEIIKTDVLALLHLTFDVIMKIQKLYDDKTEIHRHIYNEYNINKALVSYRPGFPMGIPRKIDLEKLANEERKAPYALKPGVAFLKSLQAMTAPVNSAEELYDALIKQKSNELKQGYRYSCDLPIMQSYNILGESIGGPFCITNIILKSEKL